MNPKLSEFSMNPDLMKQFHVELDNWAKVQLD